MTSLGTAYTTTDDLFLRYVGTLMHSPSRDKAFLLMEWARFLELHGARIEDGNGEYLDAWVRQLHRTKKQSEDSVKTVTEFYRLIGLGDIFTSHPVAPKNVYDLNSAAKVAPMTGQRSGSSSSRHDWNVLGGYSTVQRFVSAKSSSTARQYLVVLGRWSSFLSSNGKHAPGLMTDYDDWANSLLYGDKLKPLTVEWYIYIARRFDRWLANTKIVASPTLPRQVCTSRRMAQASIAGTTDLQLIERFLATITDFTARKQCRVALQNWFKFLKNRGAQVSDGSAEDIAAWVKEKRYFNMKAETLQTYVQGIEAFYDWHKDNSHAATDEEPPRADPQRAETAVTSTEPQEREAKLMDMEAAVSEFLGAIKNKDEKKKHTTALKRWSWFLADKGTALNVASVDDFHAWVTELHGAYLSEKTVANYTWGVRSFYRWLHKTGANIPGETLKIGRIYRAATPVTTKQEPPATKSAQEDLGARVEALIEKNQKLFDMAIAHELRLNELNDKVLAIAGSVHNRVPSFDADELVAKQQGLERQWEAVRDDLGKVVTEISTFAASAHAGYEERCAWAKEMAEMMKGMRAALYQQADEPTREILTTQPQAGETCVDEVDMLFNGAFKGLEAHNDEIIDGATKLDQASQGQAWAAKLHAALLALDDYAQSDFDGDFKSFCESAPLCHNRVPTTWVARHEPNTTSNNGRFRQERTFPVPTTVDPNGERFMYEHIIIGNGGIGPRLHYYDDKRGTGKVYIGYVGPHRLSRDTA